MPKKSKTTKSTKTTKAPAKIERFHDEITLSYAGPSAVLNRGSVGKASKTPIRLRPSSSYSDRVQSLVSDLAAIYGARPFKRGEIGAGALGRALYLGCIAYVSGADSVTSDDNGPVYHGAGATFKLTRPKSPHAPAHETLAKS